MKDLREYTTARVGLGIAGDSLPTGPLLQLRLAHSRARDAVRWPLGIEDLRSRCVERGWPCVVVASKARNRDEYLRRPDWGRVPDEDSKRLLDGRRSADAKILFLVCDGLSPLAIERHALPLLETVFAKLPHTPTEESPVILVSQARVAIADEIGASLQASVTVLLIGERPGLSSPDSLGVYLTWNPRPGRTDAERNCISNIHDSGLSYELASHKIVFLVREMQRRQVSGVALKDTSGGLVLPDDDRPTLR